MSILTQVFFQSLDLLLLARGPCLATQGCHFLGAHSQKVIVVLTDFVAGVSCKQTGRSHNAGRRVTSATVPRVHLAVILGAAVVTMSVLPWTPSPSLSGSEPIGKYSFSQSERCFMKRINSMRHHRGKRGLNHDKQLGYVARRHPRGMAKNGSIYHDSNLGSTVTRWRRLAQNVGVGGGCKSLFKAFKSSSAHRRNILGPWRHMGVGVERRGGGGEDVP